MDCIHKNRLRQSFKQYSSIGRTDKDGLSRPTGSGADRRVRDLFVADLEEEGLEVRIDKVGNIFGRREGYRKSAEPVLIGSHLDTQINGGRFDGQLGVLIGLEIIRSLNDGKVSTERPIEVVNWTNEEGARFKPPLLGSAAYANEMTTQEVLASSDQSGKTLDNELERIGYKGDAPVGGTPFSYIEPHIEQGPVLDTEGTQIGVVDGIVGMSWLNISISGQSMQAGPPPMDLRNDPMTAAIDAAHVIKRLPQSWGCDAVITIGEFDVKPNSVNVVPSQVEFSVDIRSYDNKTVKKAINDVTREVEHAARREECEATVEEFWTLPSVRFSESITRAVRSAAKENTTSYLELTSGAGHDAYHLSKICDTGMVFAPSVDGVSHAENEFTEWKDCLAVANVCYKVIMQLANEHAQCENR